MVNCKYKNITFSFLFVFFTAIFFSCNGSLVDLLDAEGSIPAEGNLYEKKTDTKDKTVEIEKKKTFLQETISGCTGLYNYDYYTFVLPEENVPKYGYNLYWDFSGCDKTVTFAVVDYNDYSFDLTSNYYTFNISVSTGMSKFFTAGKKVLVVKSDNNNYKISLKLNFDEAFYIDGGQIFDSFNFGKEMSLYSTDYETGGMSGRGGWGDAYYFNLPEIDGIDKYRVVVNIENNSSNIFSNEETEFEKTKFYGRFSGLYIFDVGEETDPSIYSRYNSQGTQLDLRDEIGNKNGKTYKPGNYMIRLNVSSSTAVYYKVRLLIYDPKNLINKGTINLNKITH